MNPDDGAIAFRDRVHVRPHRQLKGVRAGQPEAAASLCVAAGSWSQIYADKNDRREYKFGRLISRVQEILLAPWVSRAMAARSIMGAISRI